ncbi:tetratricopeptide repeat-containing sensor histidine kinase [Flagellimonas maritima]|uniref:tetratricopeptide repeat-containing sensor histidine kinase n=1 Tax=Flagellimonas maritima TaxID=1383885 RepID=UPI0013DFEFED|nr:tetratricopeptide repeat protein [Allomuricauda aurantiaca]
MNKKEVNEKKILNYLQIAKTIQSIGEKEEMKTFLEKIKSKIDLEKNNRVSFMYHLLESRNLLYHHNYSESIIECGNALKIKNFGTEEEVIYVLSSLGTCYYFKSEYEDALKNHFKALEICESMELNNCRAGILNNISVVYSATLDWQKAKDYTERALKNAELNANDFEKSRAIGNMAIVYAEKGEFKKSEEWFLKDLEFDILKGDSLSIARNYNNLGKLNDVQNQNLKALDYYRKGLQIAELQNDAASVALGYQNLGWIQHKLGRNTIGLINIQKGMQMTKDLGNRDKLRDAYLNISEFYYALDQPKKALNYFASYHDLNDSLIGENHLKAISELEIKYETEKKENEILKLSEEQLKSEVTITNQDRKLRQLSFSLVALSIITLLTFFLFKQRLQNKRQNELLLTISETQTAERKRISQDLHDSIGGSLALTKNNLQNVIGKLKEVPSEMDEALLALNQTSDQVRQISHNLMPGELVRFGLVPAINTLLEQLNKEEIHAQLYTTQMEDRIEPLKEIQLYRIVQEAIQNVLKHAKAKNLYIHLNKHKQHLSMLIEDDGIGVLSSSKEGQGLKNIEQRIKMLNGNFTLDSSKNKGTTLNIQIPI